VLGVHPERDRAVMAWPPHALGAEDRFALRLWVGLEDPADLITDLTRGFTTWAA